MFLYQTIRKKLQKSLPLTVIQRYFNKCFWFIYKINELTVVQQTALQQIWKQCGRLPGNLSHWRCLAKDSLMQVGGKFMWRICYIWLTLETIFKQWYKTAASVWLLYFRSVTKLLHRSRSLIQKLLVCGWRKPCTVAMEKARGTHSHLKELESKGSAEETFVFSLYCFDRFEHQPQYTALAVALISRTHSYASHTHTYTSHTLTTRQHSGAAGSVTAFFTRDLGLKLNMGAVCVEFALWLHWFPPSALISSQIPKTHVVG